MSGQEREALESALYALQWIADHPGAPFTTAVHQTAKEAAEKARAALAVREEPQETREFVLWADHTWTGLPFSDGEIEGASLNVVPKPMVAREDTERPDEQLREFVLTLSHGAIYAEWGPAAVVEYRDGEQVRVVEAGDTEQEHEPGVGHNKTLGNLAVEHEPSGGERAEPFREPAEDLYREMPVEQPQEDKRRWTLAGALESRNMVEVVDGPGVRMSSADEHVVVVPLARAERAESELQEALDLLELARREIESPEDDLRLGIPVHAKIRQLLRKHGRLTEGDSQ